MNKQDTNKRLESYAVSRDRFWDWLFLALLAIFGVWLLFVAFMLHHVVGVDGDWGEWGQFGDTFNIINSLFSGLAFGVIAVSLLLQRGDFAISIEEISASARAQERLADQNLLDRSERHAEIYREFNTPEMRRARTVFWATATSRWFEDAECRAYLTYHSQLGDHDSYFTLQAKMLEWTREEAGVHRDLEPYQLDIRYMNDDVVNFFSYLYDLYEGDPDRLKKVAGTFYYHWWRGYLLSWALCSQAEHARRCVEPEAAEQLPFEGKIKSLLALDDVISKSSGRFDPDIHPYYTRVASIIRSNPETYYPNGQSYLA